MDSPLSFIFESTYANDYEGLDEETGLFALLLMLFSHKTFLLYNIEQFIQENK